MDLASVIGAAPSVRAPANRLTIAIIGAMFFVFGFVTWLNGPLITFVKLAFSLNDVDAFLVPLVFYLSYFFLALPSAALLRRTGMKRGMVFGLLAMALGAVLFGQFVAWRSFDGVLASLFVIGAGLALLQTAVNPYITVVGPIESAAQRIAVMGICNKGAGLIAPIVFGLVVMRGVGDLAGQVAAASSVARGELLQTFANKVYWPYMAMAAILATMAILVLNSPLPELSGSDVVQGEDGEPTIDGRGLFDFPHLWLGVLCLFLYLGAEVMAGDAIGTYGAAFGLPLEQTAYFTSLTLAGMLAGYVTGLVVIPRFASQQTYLGWSALFGVAAVIGAYLTRDYVSVAFVAALGFANAMMWPAIFPLAVRGLGRHTETGSAVLVMSICGGAVVPQLFAHLKALMDFQLVFLLLMVPSYLYIWFYAVRGCRIERRLP